MNPAQIVITVLVGLCLFGALLLWYRSWDYTSVYEGGAERLLIGSAVLTLIALTLAILATAL